MSEKQKVNQTLIIKKLVYKLNKNLDFFELKL